jgi:predicted Rossmann fold nucleotide-binding protein DprA/Smf involved in DNA uptake
VSADAAHRYSVYVAAGGKRAVVVVNPGSDSAITAKVNLPNAGKLVMATPERPDAEATDGTLKIPARSAAVVMEL